MRRKYNAGFSVVEAVVVLVIIAILAGVGIIAWNMLTKQNQTKTASTSTATSTSKSTAQNFDDIDTSSGHVDYQFRQGPVLHSAADTSLLKGAPTSFVDYLKKQFANIPAEAKNCPSDPYQISVAKVEQGAAIGSIGYCEAGGKVIWNFADGEWGQATSTNGSGFDCYYLKKYAISQFIAGDTCVNYTTHQEEVYNPDAV